uniref:Autophagy protein 5 n=1 Tax=Arcella intermedia TaxID=1963864 RepID=A0A6B2LDT3_9EUKA
MNSVWEGVVPLTIKLANNDVASPEKPPSYYLCIPRYSYITMASSAIRKYFAEFVSPSVVNDEIWFDVGGIALKWHYPIGVLYDTYGQFQLPWSVTVHFQGFPEEQILRCPDSDTIKSHFMNTLKEAIYLKYGDIKGINNLKIPEQNDLLSGFLNNERDKFWKVLNKLNEEEQIRNVPIRIIRPDQRFVTQEPVPPKGNDGKDTTLGELLERLVPDSVSRQNNSLIIKNDVLIQGITPTLDMSLIWLSTNLANTDNFLYIILPA